MDNINFKKVLDDGELFDQQANYEENFEKINQLVVPKITDLETNKVDKVAGKGLSTNDYTTTEKNKLAGIPADTAAQLAEKANKTQASWITPTLMAGENIGAPYYPVQYMKDEFGFVHVRGSIKNYAIGTKPVIFRFPDLVGLRPISTVVLTGLRGTLTAGVAGIVEISSAGYFFINRYIGTNDTEFHFYVVFKGEV